MACQALCKLCLVSAVRWRLCRSGGRIPQAVAPRRQRKVQDKLSPVMMHRVWLMSLVVTIIIAVGTSHVLDPATPVCTIHSATSHSLLLHTSWSTVDICLQFAHLSGEQVDACSLDRDMPATRFGCMPWHCVGTAKCSIPISVAMPTVICPVEFHAPGLL